MKSVLLLVKKDYQVDFRQKYPIMGIGLYVLCTIYLTYLTFHGVIDRTTWNGILWIVVLFTSVTAMGKSFGQEDDRSLYYYYLAKPQIILLSKYIYAIGYQLILLALVLFTFILFNGNPIGNFFPFFLNLATGGLGLAITFTMVSAIATKSGEKSVMMAILGFPLTIPILVLSLNNSKQLLLGAGFSDISGNYFTLLSTIVIIIAISFILFPYSWKN